MRSTRTARVWVLGLCAWMSFATWAAEKPGTPPAKDGPTDPTPLSYEGEMLVVAAKATEGGLAQQDMAPFGKSWTNNAQALWTPTKVGSALSFPLLIGMNKDCYYTVCVAYTKAPDYGVVQLTVNGAPVGAPFDGYAPQVTHAGLVVLGNVLLKKAPAWNQFQFTIVGKHPASAGHYVGIDQLKMTPSPTGPIQLNPGQVVPVVPLPKVIPKVPLPLPKRVVPVLPK